MKAIGAWARTTLATIVAMTVLGLSTMAGQTGPPLSTPPAPPTPPAPSVSAGSSTPDQTLPPRDPGGRPPTGTGLLSGTVVTDDPSSRPIRRVAMTLSGGGLRTSRTAVTGDTGRFVFDALPSGAFMLSGQKPGYVTVQYGARRTGRGVGVPITLTDGEQFANVVLRMTHGAAISGIVIDPNGRPVREARISVLEYRFVNAERTLGPASTSSGASVIPDDRGIYRVYGLPPGEYVVAATPTNSSLQDVHPMRPADIQWAQQQLGSQTGLGGPSLSGPQGASASSGPLPAPPIGYAPVYFPGTPEVGSAISVSLAAGEERTGIDVALQYVPTARIEGEVMDPDGQPASGITLSIFRAGQPPGIGSDVFLHAAQDGTFTGSGIPPGQYTIAARSTPGPPPPPPPPPPGAGRAAAPAPGPQLPTPFRETLWAATDIAVDGQDLAGLVLALQPGMVASGRVVFEGSTLQPPEDLGAVRLSLNPAAPSPGLPASSTTANLLPDGTFVMKGITPATYRLAGSVSGAGIGGGLGWFLKSVWWNGRDVTDRLLVIQPNASLDNMVVTFSDRPAEIAGQLLDANGQPATKYTILVFTADKTFWGVSSRRTVQAHPMSDGHYRVRGLPAGEYYLSALTEVDSVDLSDPGFFEPLVNASFKISIAEGERKTQDLRLAGK